jgi:vacuolar-type H+-ATPase subunit I/STV1
MFGDIGHGGVILAVSIWMLVSDSAKKLIPGAYNVRYLLFMMGMFSFYSGWIYN